MSDTLAARLLAWYDIHARVLPWRSHPNPYRTWVSEVMLQQTQVDTVIPYFERWMQRFPTLDSLGAANQTEVLQLWEGLGYYGRARHLHQAAQLVVAKFAGILPSDLETLLSLPGIGRYTAGAILSIAFDQKQPALDGNIRRVYARVTNSSEPLGTTSSDKLLWRFAETALPESRSGDFNQALMDLGSAICTPQYPLCDRCPIQPDCQAFAFGTQHSLPVKRQKAPIPHWVVGAGVVFQDPFILLSKRPQKGLLGGLWEFPGGKLEPDDQDLPACIRRELMEELALKVVVGDQLGVYSHAYTHFKVTVHAYFCRLEPGENLSESETLRWVHPEQLADFPMGKIDRRIANMLVITSQNAN